MPDAAAFCTSRGPEASCRPLTCLTVTCRFAPATRGTAARCRVAGWFGNGSVSNRYFRSTGTLILALGIADFMAPMAGPLSAVGLGTGDGSVGGEASGVGEGVGSAP